MSKQPRLWMSELQEGMSLPQISVDVTQADINLYAEASRDFNPIHIDEVFARQTDLGGTIAHGMLVLAYISHMMTEVFGLDWLKGGQLNVRFKTPARPGDTVTAEGKVLKVERCEDQVSVRCEVLCQNQNGDSIITGTAVVKTEGQCR